MKVLDPSGETLELMTINMGPSHPATHGTLRAFMALDGENIKGLCLRDGLPAPWL